MKKYLLIMLAAFCFISFNFDMAAQGTVEINKTSKPKPKTKPTHEYVDLGLSVKWATCNVGASSPSEYGNYYAWGETSTKGIYSIDSSTTYGRSMESICGTSCDVARATWGDSWRLPSCNEMEELIDLCQWTWTSQGGHRGYKVTGPNGKSIFLPVAGSRSGTTLTDEGSYGYYWSGTPYESDSSGAYELYFGIESGGMRSTARKYGQSVRPVKD